MVTDMFGSKVRSDAVAESAEPGINPKPVPAGTLVAVRASRFAEQRVKIKGLVRSAEATNQPCEGGYYSGIAWTPP